MKTRDIHKYLGVVLLLPFIAWSATAVFFLVRPEFADAYARLEVKQYPLESPLSLASHPEWQELRYVHSILGDHLLVRSSDAWRHLNPANLQEIPYPDNASLRRLLADAMTSNTERYGNIAVLDGRQISTDTGVNIQLDWNTLSFTQEGRDTRWINRIYSIHYLEWTGIYMIDRFLGLFGLFLLMLMTYTGARMEFGWKRNGRLVKPANQTGLPGDETP